MDHQTRDRLRRGVRAAVYHACWRRLDGDEAGAQAILDCEVPAALAQAGEGAMDEAEVRIWVDEDTADFDRAVLISDLVARRGRIATSQPAMTSAAASVYARPAPRVVEDTPPARISGEVPAIADLLEGMLTQERRLRAAS